MDEHCIFCKIVSGDIPSTKVYEDDATLAFLDIRPVNKGHTLVIPKMHARNILDVPEDVWKRVATTARIVARAVRSGMHADGVNVSSSNEPAAGQEVFHLHLHVIPRFQRDGLTHWPHKTYSDGEAISVEENIKAALSE